MGPVWKEEVSDICVKISRCCLCACVQAVRLTAILVSVS